MASSPDGASRPRAGSKSKPASASAADPVFRNALRYTITAREYDKLHKFVLSRSRFVRRKVPSPAAMEKYMDAGSARRSSTAASQNLPQPRVRPDQPKGAKAKASEPTTAGDTYNARAIRHALRVFIATNIGMKAYDVLMARIKGHNAVAAKSKEPFYKSTTMRLSLSLSTILLLYRLLFRFLNRLRAHLLDPSASPFRQRNPRTAQALTSPIAPAIGASLAGLALGVYPSSQFRLSVAIYTIFRALEFGWNMLEGDGSIWGFRARAGGKGLIKNERPWWWGSWLLQPFAFGQILHASVFDRDCAPAPFLAMLFKGTTTYLHEAPANLPAGMSWLDPSGVADNLAEMAKLKWPSFVSPAMFPGQQTLPPSLSALAPLTAQAHPLITSLSCATLHPTDPSCARTLLTFWAQTLPRVGRVLVLVYSLMMLPKYKLLYNSPLYLINKLLAKSLRMSTFVTGSLSTVWASICFFQNWFPRNFLPTQRFFFGGFLAGLWAFIERKSGHGMFLYTARASVDSLWKVGVKRRWWKAMRGGDVWVFVLALAITGAVYERDAAAIREGSWRKGVSWIQGTEFRDWGFEEDEEEKEEGYSKDE
ncbi:hypothetical protein Micbo1qcDRAFT_6619 [Microdochium bolleyi]|uniref:Transmembrane protein 135 N-terminal domain-containing protein n=1 Tax=Microdochium bolleyi TaxID=196109 RepID=A0A136JJD0_9PEZI|nr:hypothetical protein Micbo1qcDRAFT_6619 [Microdochium bolleyi]